MSMTRVPMSLTHANEMVPYVNAMETHVIDTGTHVSDEGMGTQVNDKLGLGKHDAWDAHCLWEVSAGHADDAVKNNLL